MAFDEDLLADLNDLDGDFSADEHTPSAQQPNETRTDQTSEYRTSNNPTTHGITALGQASTTGTLGHEHEALISKLATQSSDLRRIAQVCYSRELQELVEKINLSQDKRMQTDEQAIIGRIEDDPDYLLVLQANDVSSRIGGEVLVVHRFLADRFQTRFPELETLVRSPLEYAKTVKKIGNAADLTKVELSGILPSATRMVVTVTGSTTAGRPLSAEEQAHVDEACDCLLSLIEAQQLIVDFIESRMPLIAPNLVAVVGAATAARLIVEAGGLTALSKIPSCNIQVLGKSHQAATGLSALTTNRHAGVIFYSDVVRSVPEDFRHKMLRKVSAKCALAVRVDSQHQARDGSAGRRFREELDAQVEKLLEAAPLNAIKPLPVPDDGPKHRRGGRKVRKARAAYESSELQKQRDRLQFGTMQEEVVIMDEMEGAGMLGRTVGRVRATQASNKVKSRVAKKYEKYMRPQNTAASGLATSGLASIAFTPTQGFEIASPQVNPEEAHARKRAKTAHDKYFGSATPYQK
ncbi:U4/U6-U5 snRNP complex subunit prp31 [Coemansia sp. Benny D115]|nr:U4/U6-U5 snRNP complex subunit prp31 [Coemansia sp. Benny D115]